MEKATVLLTLFFILGCGGSNNNLHCNPSTKQVGIWYSTWYKASSKRFFNLTPSEGLYDSGDVGVIDAHINLLEEAGVDFAILDNTNNLHVDGGYILDNSIRFSQRLVHSKLKLVVAIGGMQYSHSVSSLAQELLEVRQLFIDSVYGSAYLRSARGPVIVSYAPDGLTETDELNISASFPQWDIKWVHGKARDEEWGWATPDMATPSCDSMAVMPGWSNMLGEHTDRQGGRHYAKAWENILKTKPSTVIISSYNDFAEQTAVAPTVQYGNGYWESTKQYIKEYKQ